MAANQTDPQPEPAADQIVCATYTHARRHPMVLGKIAGWTPPFQLSVSQLIVIVVTIWVETQTWRWWAAPLPRVLALGVGGVLPLVLAWAVRRTRIEGRSLPRAALGWTAWLATPTGGRANGRTCRPTRPTTAGGAWVFVAAGDPRR